jgi:hypothetical protein
MLMMELPSTVPWNMLKIPSLDVVKNNSALSILAKLPTMLLVTLKPVTSTMVSVNSPLEVDVQIPLLMIAEIENAQPHHHTLVLTNLNQFLLNQLVVMNSNVSTMTGFGFLMLLVLPVLMLVSHDNVTLPLVNVSSLLLMILTQQPINVLLEPALMESGHPPTRFVTLLEIV